jgi:hypothetical protein
MTDLAVAAIFAAAVAALAAYLWLCAKLAR